MDKQVFLRGMAKLVVAAESDADSMAVLVALAEGRAALNPSNPLTNEDYAAFDTAYLALSGDSKKAPAWAHALLDFIWALF